MLTASSPAWSASATAARSTRLAIERDAAHGRARLLTHRFAFGCAVARVFVGHVYDVHLGGSLRCRLRLGAPRRTAGYDEGGHRLGSALGRGRASAETRERRCQFDRCVGSAEARMVRRQSGRPSSHLLTRPARSVPRVSTPGRNMSHNWARPNIRRSIKGHSALSTRRPGDVQRPLIRPTGQTTGPQRSSSRRQKGVERRPPPRVVVSGAL